MTWLGDIANNVFRNIVFGDTPPNVVLEVRSDKYSNRHIHCREEGIMLYGPGDRNNDKYEIVLHRPCQETLSQSFSLFRSESLEVAEVRFTVYKDKVPVLVQLCKDLCNVTRIQKLCDTLSDHPTWTLAHLAAHLALYDVFKHLAVNKDLNTSDQTTGISPLQVAIQTNNLQMVVQLINERASIEHLDYTANTVYHYAAGSTKDIVFALGPNSPNVLNSRNSQGQTPLHVACHNDKPECVKALLMIGADVNISASESTANGPSYVSDLMNDNAKSLSPEDMKFGGTPLHWSSSREVVNALIEVNCDINALNFDGRTALHIMVMRKRLDCIMALLSHMATVNIADNQGNTPLHLAVQKGGLLPIVQMLIGFGADIDAKNFNNETPRHLVDLKGEGEKILYALHAVGAKRCDSTMKDCGLGCRQGETFHGIAPPEPPTSIPRTILDQMLYVASMAKMASQGNSKLKGGRLLCLDGGGIRGLVLVQTLIEIEAVLQKPIVSCFDWIAGTSTGGILALGLAAGKSLRECQALYFRIKQDAFVGSRPYSSDSLEKVLKDCLGADTVMADIKVPKLMITGVLADRKPVDLHIFRNYPSPSYLMKIPPNPKFKATLMPEEQLLWKAARATGAAPSYFRAFGRFLDGGLIANNPTLDAMTEIHEYCLALKAVGREEEATPLSLVVSLGTGAIPVSPLKDIDVFRPESLWDTMRLGMGISALGTLLVDQATAADGRVVDRARTWCSMAGIPYYRFNPRLSADVVMDEKNDEILADMIWTAKAFMHANRDQVKELAAVMSRDP
ncbi:85/88 kDa calcium-independent phospholipase A2 [Microplitis demolitor]|uniref:85/88 kDa calcium-independent phospholipase A2 n=1 Tax=Microplitis demolitor TaxID=69319 RepID=UPI0004CD3587|nr:85/88 kDa calcium-independent phospholipase A2 [Microplitis demolitor]